MTISLTNYWLKVWAGKVRLRSKKLFFKLIIIFPFLKQVLKTAELVGLFVEPHVYTKLILARIQSVCSSTKALSSTLRILSRFIKTSNYCLITGHINVNMPFIYTERNKSLTICEFLNMSTLLNKQFHC